MRASSVQTWAQGTATGGYGRLGCVTRGRSGADRWLSPVPAHLRVVCAAVPAGHARGRRIRARGAAARVNFVGIAYSIEEGVVPHSHRNTPRRGER